MGLGGGTITMIIGGAVGFGVGLALQPFVALDALPGVRDWYQPTAKVTLEGAVAGPRERKVEVETSRGQLPNHQFVVWTTQAKNGMPDLQHVYPYYKPAAGSSRQYGVAAGGDQGDQGNTFFVQTCDVTGDALAKVDRYLGAAVYGSAPQDDRANIGIDLSTFDADIRCSPTSAAMMTRKG